VEDEGVAVKDELEVRKSAVVRAVEPRALATADDAAKLAVDHVGQLRGTSDHGGAAVDDSLAAPLAAEVAVLEVDGVHLDLPVVLLSKRNVLEITLEESLIVATEGELTAHHAGGVTSKPEGEHLLVNKTLLHHVVPDRGGVADRDGVESKTKNTVKLANGESETALLGNLSKVLTLHDDVRETDDIIADKAADVAAAVCDIEAGAVGLVGAALSRVITLVELAGKLSALDGGDPQVAGAGIKDNLELLAGGTDGDGAVELSLRVVGKRDIVVVASLVAETHVGTLGNTSGTLVRGNIVDLNRNVHHCCCKNNKGEESKNKTHYV